MSKLKDHSYLIGQKFGKLLILNTVRKNGKKYLVCLCDCGVKKEIFISDVLLHKTASCGCKLRKHGYRKTKLYKLWVAIKDRSLNIKSKKFKDYGGRGIDMFEEWINSFEKFMNDAIRLGYKEGLQIDRIDNNRGYYPDNVRFVDGFVNNNNKRNNVKKTLNGETHTVAEWTRMHNYDRQLIYGRLRRGWTFEEALLTPTIDNISKITYQGVTNTYAEWSKIVNIPASTLHRRIATLGWSIEKALTTSAKKINKRVDVEIEYNGVTKTIIEWSIILGIKYAILYERLFRHNWSVEKAFTTPVRKRG